ncbi:hypothetical protein [Lutimonas vermicola]|uniref:Glycosyl transferase family 1 domain-containing protein n=1 Tax=Lutimonas vermicola TaxID=414288 RepID=A0ABU9L460_9FLAO
MSSTVFIISPTESILTKRGKRHPNLASFLVKKGVKIEYYTSTINHAEKKKICEEEINNALKKSDYPITFFDAGLYKTNITVKRVFWNIRFANKVFWKLVRESKKGDIIVFPSRPSELLLVGFILKKIKRIKLFLDVEDPWPDGFLINNKIIKFLFFSYCNILNYISISSFDDGVHVSPSFLDWLKRYNHKFDSTFTPLGITPDEDKPEFIKNYLEEPKIIKFFYGGTLSLAFDILPILKAFSNNKQRFELILAGDDGSGNRYKAVHSFLIKNDIKHDSLGILSKKDLINNLGKCDIAIVPMVVGGLPKKFFDAIGCHKPILSLGSGGTSIEVKEKQMGWTSSFDSNEIIQILDEINKESLNNKINNIRINRDYYFEQNSINIITNKLKIMMNN